jgi:cohesin complex subunit SCC1
MFYSEYILSKRGPLGQVWLAAHWDHRKLNKADVNRADIRVCVGPHACSPVRGEGRHVLTSAGACAENVIQPPVPLALRLSAQLLLGVARIYSRKAKYLLDDCSEALAKVKLVRREAA